MPAGKSALVTGGGSGIGAALCIALAERGYQLTIADRDEPRASDVAERVRRAGGQAQAVACDVQDDAQQEALFRQHTARFGGLDACFLNAGVLELGNVLSPDSPGRWQDTLDIDLRAQMVGARLAAAAMAANGSKGVLVFTASAGGIYPMPDAPVYAAAKAGLVNFARSIAPRLAKRGIRVCALCPQAVDTPMVGAALQVMGAAGGGAKQQALQAGKAAGFGSLGGRLLTPAQATEAALWLLEGDAAPGTVLLLHVSGHAYAHSFHRASLRRLSLADRGGKFPPPLVAGRETLLRWVTAAPPPATRTKVQVFRLSADFRVATRLAGEPLPRPGPGELLVRRAWAGVNASDVNFTSGRYFGSPQQSAERLPFDAGFEAVGVVAAVGPGVAGLRVGDAVAELAFGTFCEWGVVSQKLALPAPTAAPEVVALLTSGLTASIGLEVAGQMGSGETVLVTAAAGGTGQFAVQLAKAAGNRVVATCGGADKAALLKRLGADRVINHRQEDVGAVLKAEFPKGVDLVWESVGGAMFQTCLKALAPGGRLIIIGMMSQYGSGWQPAPHAGLPELLLWKGAGLRGFFLPQHARHYRRHLQALTRAWLAGQLAVSLDPARFVGAEQAADAVEHLQGGGSIGKVVLQLAREVPAAQPPAKL